MSRDHDKFSATGAQTNTALCGSSVTEKFGPSSTVWKVCRLPHKHAGDHQYEVSARSSGTMAVIPTTPTQWNEYLTMEGYQASLPERARVNKLVDKQLPHPRYLLNPDDKKTIIAFAIGHQWAWCDRDRGDEDKCP